MGRLWLRRWIFDALRRSELEEQFIEWADVGTFKVEYHQKFIKEWLETEELSLPFEEVWEIRERCIAALA